MATTGRRRQRSDLSRLLEQALAHHQGGRFGAAERLYRKILKAKPDDVEALHFLGILCAQQGRVDEALASLDRAIALEPDYADASYNRGNALAAAARYEEALASYDQALALRPDYIEALENRGNVLSELHRYGEALTCYDRVLAALPDHAGVLNRRGQTLQELRRFEEAVASYDRALAIGPDDADAFYNRGGALQELNRHDDAVASFDRAIAIRPDYAEAHYSRGQSLRSINLWREAIASYTAALAQRPDFAEARLALCMAQLPILYADAAEVDERRAAYEKELRALCDDVDAGKVGGDLAKAVGGNQPFYLGYQARNDRDLQQLYGSLACRVMAQRYPAAPLPAPPAAQEPVRVGIVSGFFWWHSVWKIPIKGWVSQLDRKRFKVFGYHTAADRDAATAEAASMCDRFVQGPMPIERWRETIAADAPHVLLYPDIGMDAVSAALAAQRLAPVQCMSLGHPDSSGFSTLDYFLTSDLMEPAGGEAHYSERLVRLPNISVYYDPAEAPPVPLDRNVLGLRPSTTVYWCGQSLFKYLPQFDEVFARIARAAGDCQFAFIRYPKGAHATDLFRRRLERAFAAHGLRVDDHCVILPRLDQHQFVAAIGQCDVVLDSIGWSGFNSTVESLQHHLPVVTLCGDLMRGRHSTGVLRMMGVTETIAETVDDYVAIAARLATDAAWRQAVKDRMTANRNRVYRDNACIAALEEFLNRVARHDRGG